MLASLLPLQVSLVGAATTVGVVVAVVSSIGSAAYIYGRQAERGASQTDTVETNSDQLAELAEEIGHLQEATISLSESVEGMQETMATNREDIQHQHRLMHDQLLPEDGDCGNPDCPYCFPENVMDEFNVSDPLPDGIGDRFSSFSDTDD